MDILYAFLWKQALPDATGRREHLPAGGPVPWARPLLALLLIVVLVGSIDVAARGDGIDIAAAANRHPIGKGN